MRLSTTAEWELGKASQNLLGHSIRSIVVGGSCTVVVPAFNRIAAHVVCILSQGYVKSVQLQQSDAFDIV